MLVTSPLSGRDFLHRTGCQIRSKCFAPLPNSRCCLHSRSPLTPIRPPHALLLPTRSCFVSNGSLAPTSKWVARCSALGVPRPFNGFRPASPPGILQPDVGCEVHDVAFRAFPDRCDSFESDRRWDPQEHSRRALHPSKTCSSSTAEPPHDVSCLLAVHNQRCGSHSIFQERCLG